MVPWQVKGACAKNGMFTILSMSCLTGYYAVWIEEAVSESFLKGGLSYDVSHLYVTKPDNSYHMR
jgi:hypothetical protein